MGVSVIIPCRNQASTLGRAIKSAIAAGANEVLVFDDASDIDVLDIVKSITSDVYIGLFTETFRSGVAYARNALIDTAKNEWIIPLDADDELLQIPPTPDDWRYWVYGGWIEHYEDGTEKVFEPNHPKMLKNKPLCHATMLFSKTLWANLGGYDPDFAYAEDYDWQCNLYAANGNLAIRLDTPLYKRYVGNNERTDKAKRYWDFYHALAKSKYPNIFN